MRAGIHVGPVVAGIVGVKKFQYDIWGDTVNTASRLESSGQVGRVNISAATYELVKEEFTCEYRGEIVVKGKGKLGMYFVKERI
jgi:class 3 adenylate cyclase